MDGVRFFGSCHFLAITIPGLLVFAQVLLENGYGDVKGRLYSCIYMQQIDFPHFPLSPSFLLCVCVFVFSIPYLTLSTVGVRSAMHIIAKVRYLTLR
jgi:hypothetical protein